MVDFHKTPPNETNGEGAAYAQAVKNAKGPPRTFKIWTGDDIWKPIEPPDYLIDGLLVRGCVSLIAAYGSSLKTWLLLDSALSVTTGTPWLGRFPTKRGKALIVDFESGSYELRRRLHRLARGRELPIPIDAFSFVTMPDMSLADDAFFEAIAPLAKEHAFIGIDALASGSPGLDENEARFARSLNRLKEIAEATPEPKCVFEVLHHARKTKETDADLRQIVRGSSAIFNACDVVLVLQRSAENTVVHQIKARGGKYADPFLVRVDDATPDASIVVAGNVPEPGDGETMGTAKALGHAKRAILLAVSHGEPLTSKNQVYNRIPGTKAVKVKALAELIESNLVIECDHVWKLTSEVDKLGSTRSNG